MIQPHFYRGELENSGRQQTMSSIFVVSKPKIHLTIKDLQNTQKIYHSMACRTKTSMLERNTEPVTLF